MDVDLNAIDIEVPAIDQVGIVVEDLEDGMDRFGRMLGIDTWRIYEFAPPALSETVFQGEERTQSWRLCLATVGDIDIELIEPLDGENTYTHHLDAHGEGIHHLACFAFDEPRAVVEEYTNAGVPIEQSGVYKGSTFWYLDMRDAMNGLIFEIVETGDDGPAEPDDRYRVGE